MDAAYERFARVYDQFMHDAPYGAWQAWFVRQPERFRWRVADVGCGTGRLTVSLARDAAQVFGVDVSESMLAEAAARAHAAHVQVAWLCQDMRWLRLPAAVDVLLATCDSVNYLLTDSDWAQTLAAFRAALTSGGRLCFDTLGPARLTALRQGCWYDLQPDADLWFTSDLSETGRIRYEVHAYVLADPVAERYEKVWEQHVQQYWAPEQVIAMLGDAGFSVDRVAGDFGARPVEQADRVVYVATKRA